jgi:DNA-directed RNA polymerase specialized sigma24 family protein
MSTEPWASSPPRVPVKAEVVKLRFYVGLTHLEVAALLEISEKTARRHWQVAKIRLFQLISER